MGKGLGLGDTEGPFKGVKFSIWGSGWVGHVSSLKFRALGIRIWVQGLWIRFLDRLRASLTEGLPALRTRKVVSLNPKPQTLNRVKGHPLEILGGDGFRVP